MKLVGFLPIWLLAACASTSPAPIVTRSETVTVKVPVPVACLKLDEVPAIPKSVFRRDGDLRSNAAASAADLLALEAYAVRADALLRNCAK